jgi:acetoin utilization protein AcuB
MMLVQDIMQRDVVAVTPETPLARLVGFLQRRGVRHLPVTDRGRLVGIISDRDLKGAIASVATSESVAPASRLDHLTAADIMARSVVTIAPMFAVEEAARLMVTRKISALPVTEDGHLVGIVTDSDVLHLFVRALGVTEPTSRIDVVLGVDAHALDTVVHAVTQASAVISSIMTMTSPVTGLREAMIRLATINPGPAIKALEAEGFTVRDSWRG